MPPLNNKKEEIKKMFGHMQNDVYNSGHLSDSWLEELMTSLDQYEEMVRGEIATRVEELKGGLTMKWDDHKQQSWAYDKVLDYIRELTNIKNK